MNILSLKLILFVTFIYFIYSVLYLILTFYKKLIILLRFFLDKIVLVTGGYDPLHSGHINLFIKASKIGKKLIVGINSNKWLVRKKGFYFIPRNERKMYFFE